MIEYLKIGQIINTHGIKGEVKIYPLTDNIKRFNDLNFVFFKNKSDYKRINIQSVKYIKNFVILKLEGIESIDDAKLNMDRYIYVDRENAVELPEDTYFVADLIGLEVYTDENELLGKITSVIETGSNDVYQIKMENGKDLLIPAIRDVVLEVNLEARKMTVHLLEGLL